MAFDSIESIIEDLRLGRMVIIVDDEDRENEGDLVMAAECVRPADVNFMIREARGLLCMPMTAERAARLGLSPMIQANESPYHTNFTVSIEAASGVTTGISAADRARTLQVAAAAEAQAADLVRPGHIFPLIAKPGGVLQRAGHTEAGCDLVGLAGLAPTAALIEILRDDGDMARRPELEQFAQRHGLKMGSIEALIQYRLRTEPLLDCVQRQTLEFAGISFQHSCYRDRIDGQYHDVFLLGPDSELDPATATVCVCAPTLRTEVTTTVDLSGLESALTAISQAGRGCLVRITSAPAGEAERRPWDPRGWLPQLLGQVPSSTV